MSEVVSSTQFSVGEIAIFHRVGSRFDGTEVSITKPLHLANVYDHKDGSRTLEYVYGVDSPAFSDVRPVNPDGFCARPSELKKRPPPQEMEEIGSWAECPWKPEIEYA